MSRLLPIRCLIADTSPSDLICSSTIPTPAAVPEYSFSRVASYTAPVAPAAGLSRKVSQASSGSQADSFPPPVGLASGVSQPQNSIRQGDFNKGIIHVICGDPQFSGYIHLKSGQQPITLYFTHGCLVCSTGRVQSVASTSRHHDHCKSFESLPIMITLADVQPTTSAAKQPRGLWEPTTLSLRSSFHLQALDSTPLIYTHLQPRVSRTGSFVEQASAQDMDCSIGWIPGHLLGDQWSLQQ